MGNRDRVVSPSQGFKAFSSANRTMLKAHLVRLRIRNVIRPTIIRSPNSGSSEDCDVVQPPLSLTCQQAGYPGQSLGQWSPPSIIPPSTSTTAIASASIWSMLVSASRIGATASGTSISISSIPASSVGETPASAQVLVQANDDSTIQYSGRPKG